MRRPVQQLLGIASPARRRVTLEDRGYGTTETPTQRGIRLQRERLSHERATGRTAGQALRGQAQQLRPIRTELVGVLRRMPEVIERCACYMGHTSNLCECACHPWGTGGMAAKSEADRLRLEAIRAD